MAKAFNHKVRRAVTLPEDEALEATERTEFVLRPLTLVDDAEIAAALGENAQAQRPLLYALEVIRHGLVNVRRWPNPAFDPAARETPDGPKLEPRYIPFERASDGHASRALLDHLSQGQMLFLYRQVMKGEAVEPVEAGKS